MAVSDRRPHVVFLDHVARLSGGEIALLRLLPELGHHIRVTVILGEDGPLAEKLSDSGIPAEVLPLPSRVRDLRRETINPRLDVRVLAPLPRYVARLRRRIEELEPDLIHTNSLKSAMYGGAAGRLARVPVVWHIRDRIAPDYLPATAVGLVRLLSRFLPSGVIANSAETMSTLPARSNARVLYNAILPDVVAPRRRLTRHEWSGLTIGVIGRVTPWKGQDVFLDAFARAFGGTTARARIVGSALFGEDDYAAALVDRSRTLGISDQVEFRGFREDVWAELRDLDILVHCSVRPEPFGQVVLEGLAAGVPVVAANAGGPKELITNGVNGILTTPGDSRELADALKTLADDWVLRAKIAAAGRRRSKDFAPGPTVEQLLAFYEPLLAR